MAQQVQWTTNLTIAGGPVFTLPGSLVVDAYDHVKLSIKKGEKSAAVQLPGQAGQVKLVLINATSDGLTYTVGDAKAAAGTALDEGQLFAGVGAVSLLGAPPITLTFNNSGGAQDATVEVLVGRNTA
jgi:hypothetical protein